MRKSQTQRLLPAMVLLAVSGSLSAEPPDAHELPHAFTAGWRGEATCERLLEDKAVRVARCTFPPGAGHERHFHRPHFGYTISGGQQRIVDASGVREVTVATGTHWSSDSVTVHETLNIGDTTTTYLIVEPVSDEPQGD